MTDKQLATMKELLREYYTEKYGEYPTTIAKVGKVMTKAEHDIEKEKEEQELINWLYKKDKQMYKVQSKIVCLTYKENFHANTI